MKKGEFEFAKEKYIIEYSKTRGVKFEDNIFYVNYQMLPELIEKYIVKYLILKYTPRIENYVNQLNKSTYNFNIKGIELKLVESKWGHCTFDNKLMFNLKLLNVDPQILDYVIFHELSHIKHKNHSSNFWNEVSKFCPNHKFLRKKLKDNPPNIFY